jgi:hypothetical protein
LWIDSHSCYWARTSFARTGALDRFFAVSADPPLIHSLFDSSIHSFIHSFIHCLIRHINNMGNAPTSGLLPQHHLPQHPRIRRPLDARGGYVVGTGSNSSHKKFNHNSHTACLVHSFLPQHSSKTSAAGGTILQQLILAQEWQRVLVRIDLFPHELKVPIKLKVYGLHLQTMPLALVCALDPPEQVVQRMLELNVDATAVPVQSVLGTNKNKNKVDGHGRRFRRFRRGRNMTRTQHQQAQQAHLAKTRPRLGHPSRKQANLVARWREWRTQRRGAFPVALPEEDETLLLPKTSLYVKQEGTAKDEQGGEELGSTSTSVYYSVHEELMNDDDHVVHHTDNQDDDNKSSHPSSLSSHLSTDDSLEKQGVILQLSPSGGLQPMAVNSQETESTSDNSSSLLHHSVFCVHWDLTPLQEVASQGQLLALHVACLFQASARVIHVLAEAYPLAALVDVLGMLPIHWVAAGWTLPTILPQPESILPPEVKAGPLPTLQVLKDIVPDSIRVTSGNHTLTPAAYAEECMEEGDYKEACLHVLYATKTDLEDCSISTAGSLLFVDSSETSSLCFSPSSVVHDGQASTITFLLTSKNWSGALAAVEDDPSVAYKWLYGVDDQDLETSMTVWKRLPIHLASANGAPVGLLEVLLQAYPGGGTEADPHNGYLPLHILCQNAPTLASIRLLLSLCPESTKAVDMQGRLPLHLAIINAAPYTVIEAMVEEDPDSAIALDQDSKTPYEYASMSYGREHVVSELLAMVRIFLQEKSF